MRCKIAVVGLLSLFAWAAHPAAQAAAPAAQVAPPDYCQGLVLDLPDGEKARLGSAIAPQLGVKSAQLTLGFGSGDWRIYYVQPENMEPAYLFFMGDPSSHHYRGLWAGVSTGDDEPSIEHWLKANVAGLPNKLGRCFAYHVTGT